MSILGPTLILLYINGVPDVFCNIVIYADDTNLYSRCDQSSDLWQQLELASELPNFRTYWSMGHCGLGQEVACWFQSGKTQRVSFGWSNNTSAIDVKMDGSILEEKSSFKMLGVTFLQYLYC